MVQTDRKAQKAQKAQHAKAWDRWTTTAKYNIGLTLVKQEQESKAALGTMFF